MTARFAIGICIFVFTFSSSVLALQKATPQSSEIAGVVIDQNGAPVEGAEVTMLAGPATARTKTDTAGQFHFTSVPFASITLNITASGFAPVPRKLEPATEDITQLRIVLL
ncbi:MAG: carboxypeptidase-like regulatory domain-containing protein, partial [Acidobacteriota bacterium]|nr:carboxypeptidase-like regulatory domain-containing protein [Acidobacteriota bacterium]